MQQQSVLLLLLCAVAWRTAGAGRVSMLVDPGPSSAGLYLTPNTTNPPTFHNQLYGPMGAPTAVWHITQWDSPDPLPPTASVPPQPSPCRMGSPLWFTSSRAGYVCAYPQGTSAPGSITLELQQDGTQSVCGSEFDTFLEPNTDVFARYPQGLRPLNTSLLGLSDVTVSFGANLLNATVLENRCGSSPQQCGPSGKVDYGYGVLGVVVNNPTAGQTLFYQVYLGDTRDGVCPTARISCNPAPLFWYSTENPYGASNTAGEYQQPCLGMGPKYGVRGKRVPYTFNVLPFISSTIQQGPASMDKDLSRWQVGEIYIGIGLEGSVAQTLLLDSVQFSATVVSA